MQDNPKLAICQMQISANIEENLPKAEALVQQAVHQGAEIVVLPEMFHIPYSPKLMQEYAEAVPGQITQTLSKIAKDNNIILIGGSMAESAEGKIYNTCTFFGPNGALWGKYRKIHLFDINIPGKVVFQESSVLGSGQEIWVKKTPLVDFSVMICYDARFPELFKIMTRCGVQLIIIPASFSVPTGSDHWELTMRARAVDHQVFIAAASSARNPENTFQPYGHSMIVDPWGNILAEAGIDEEIIMAELNLPRLEEIRGELPLLKHERHDLYTVQAEELKIYVV